MALLGAQCLTESNGAVRWGWSAKERPSRAWGEGEGEGGEARSVLFYEGLRLWEARFVVFYEGLRLWEARFVVFYQGLRLWGGSGSNHAVTPGWSAKEKPSRALGEGGSCDHMSSSDVGSYELKLSSCEMQMEECSADLARSTAYGSADIPICFLY